MHTLKLMTGLALPLLLAVTAGCSGLLDPDDPGNLVPGTVDDDPSLPAVELQVREYLGDEALVAADPDGFRRSFDLEGELSQAREVRGEGGGHE